MHDGSRWMWMAGRRPPPRFLVAAGAVGVTVLAWSLDCVVLRQDILPARTDIFRATHTCSTTSDQSGCVGGESTVEQHEISAMPWKGAVTLVRSRGQTSIAASFVQLDLAARRSWTCRPQLHADCRLQIAARQTAWTSFE